MIIDCSNKNATLCFYSSLIENTNSRAQCKPLGSLKGEPNTPTEKKKEEISEGQRLTSMLDKFQDIHSAPRELRLDCCDWPAGRIPELSILMGLELVCADVHTVQKMGGRCFHGVRSACSVQQCRAQEEVETDSARFAVHAPAAVLSPLREM